MSLWDPPGEKFFEWHSSQKKLEHDGATKADCFRKVPEKRTTRRLYSRKAIFEALQNPPRGGWPPQGPAGRKKLEPDGATKDKATTRRGYEGRRSQKQPPLQPDGATQVEATTRRGYEGRLSQNRFFWQPKMWSKFAPRHPSGPQNTCCYCSKTMNSQKT